MNTRPVEKYFFRRRRTFRTSPAGRTLKNSLFVIFRRRAARPRSARKFCCVLARICSNYNEIEPGFLLPHEAPTLHSLRHRVQDTDCDSLLSHKHLLAHGRAHQQQAGPNTSSTAAAAVTHGPKQGTAAVPSPQRRVQPVAAAAGLAWCCLRLWPSLLLLLAAAPAAATAAAATEIKATRSCRVGR